MKRPSFVGRARALGVVRSALDRAEAGVLRVEGMRGVGKTALLERALRDFPHLLFRVPALPDPLQRRALAEALEHATSGEPSGPAATASPADEPPPAWPALFERALERARPGRRPFVLALDDVHRLGESRARWRPPLHAALRRARDEGRSLHVLLAGPLGSEAPPDDAAALYLDRLRLEPLPLRAAARLLPGGAPEAVLRAYGVFGGIPTVLRAVDPEVGLDTNIRKLLLEPDGPLADLPAWLIERDLQAPARYNAILAAIAHGEREWSELHAGVPDLGTSGQMAPYLRRLEGLGLVRVRRSLDAPPTSRARRYAAVDPFLGFWYRFVLPVAGSLRERASVDEHLRRIRAALDDHMAAFFPLLCRQHMVHDAIETLGANARESGSLWGSGYDLPVAGILGSGAAFYGASLWRALPRAEDPFGKLDAAVRETRYGFGRQNRLRLLFTGFTPPRWLEREGVRRDQTFLIGPAELVGER